MQDTNTNESAENYLKRILMLQEEGNPNVHAIDIATSMNFSKASVSIALKKLENEGYVTVGPKQVLNLTEAGMAIAKKVYGRYIILHRFFVALGVDDQTAFDDACRIEHDLSESTFQALKKVYEEKVAHKD
jgi:Mn-dependent DtxR family transcriptional regulator